MSYSFVTYIPYVLLQCWIEFLVWQICRQHNCGLWHIMPVTWLIR
jgi:hypothetical protein